jgi:hypothetical protein
MNIPESFQSMDDTSKLVILSATVIIVFILFSKVIKVILKIAVIAAMLFLIAYFLRQNGII